MISIEEGKFSKLFLWYLTRTVSYFSILPLSFCSHHNFPLPLLSIRYLNGNPGRNSNYFGNLGYFRNFRVSSTSAPLVSRLSIKKENINLLMFQIIIIVVGSSQFHICDQPSWKIFRPKDNEMSFCWKIKPRDCKHIC